MKFSVVESFTYPYEAQIAKSKLASVGIEAFIDNEHLVQINWLYSNAVGGVRLKVFEHDFEEAVKILSSDDEGSLRNEFSENISEPCPKCQSENTAYITVGKRWAFLIWLLLQFPVLKPWNKMKCKDCGYMWK